MLSNRISAIFNAHKVQNFQFAQDAVALVRGERRRWVWRLICGAGWSLLLGIAIGMYAQRPQLNAIQGTTAAWYQDCKDRHPSGPKVTNKAAAQVIVEKRSPRNEEDN